MKIGVVGAGISGMAAAYVLGRQHDVWLFEQDARLGGHANTVTVTDRADRKIPIDTGFIVFNEPNYPYLNALFAQLDVSSIASDMSFSVHCDRTGYEFNGTDLNRLFVQRSNIAKLSHWRMLRHILRFHRVAHRYLDDAANDTMSVEQFVEHEGFGREFFEHYLVPLGASLWSTGAERFKTFPIRFVIEFLHNHAMLQVDDRPQWRTVKGGSIEYVRRLRAALRATIIDNSPVSRVRRGHRGDTGGHDRGWVIHTAEGPTFDFDEVVLALHADDALSICEDLDDDERGALECFPYQQNEVALHAGDEMLPDRRPAWAAWNYRIPCAAQSDVSVTYYMNYLQQLETDDHFCVTLNPNAETLTAESLARFTYRHPTYSPGRGAVQAAHEQFVRRKGRSFCGAYWGYGFHEDGIASAMRVCAAYGLELDHA